MTSPVESAGELEELGRDVAQTDAVRMLLELAIEEDIGDGDVTTELVVPEGVRARAQILARADGVVCGLPVIERLAELLETDIDFQIHVAEGESVMAGTEIANLVGDADALLAIERTALNILQRLSGIATKTRGFVDAVDDTDAAILETRKTVPGWRLLDKYAVRAGGGTNHRMGLFDQVLAKENHFAIARAGGRSGDFRLAVADLVERCPDDLVLEVEVENLDQFDIALEAGVDIILLDNMSLDDMETAVERRDDWEGEHDDEGPELEASGNVTEETVADVAATGVDRISVGALTHSVVALDMSMLLESL